MGRDWLRHALVTFVGFCLGVLLAMCVAPGDRLLWVVVGIVLGIYGLSFFDRVLGGQFPWHRPHGRDSHRASATIGRG